MKRRKMADALQEVQAQGANTAQAMLWPGWQYQQISTGKGDHREGAGASGRGFRV